MVGSAYQSRSRITARASSRITLTETLTYTTRKQTTMDTDNINDVLTVAGILDSHGAGRSANLIAALLDWRNGGGGNIAPSAPEPVAAQPDPEPPKPPAKAAPAKAAKGRAKPPPPPVDDDDSKEPSPDPSDDDADF